MPRRWKEDKRRSVQGPFVYPNWEYSLETFDEAREQVDGPRPVSLVRVVHASLIQESGQNLPDKLPVTFTSVETHAVQQHASNEHLSEAKVDRHHTLKTVHEGAI